MRSTRLTRSLTFRPPTDLITPTNCQRDVDAVFQQIRLGPWKRHSVITRHDHDGTIQFSTLLKQGEHSAKMLVEPLDLVAIVENVAADDRYVGQELRNEGFLKLTTVLHADARLIRSMRFRRSEPKARTAAHPFVRPKTSRRRPRNRLHECRPVHGQAVRCTADPLDSQ